MRFVVNQSRLDKVCNVAFGSFGSVLALTKD